MSKMSPEKREPFAWEQELKSLKEKSPPEPGDHLRFDADLLNKSLDQLKKAKEAKKPGQNLPTDQKMINDFYQAQVDILKKYRDYLTEQEDKIKNDNNLLKDLVEDASKNKIKLEKTIGENQGKIKQNEELIAKVSKELHVKPTEIEKPLSTGIPQPPSAPPPPPLTKKAAPPPTTPKKKIQEKPDFVAEFKKGVTLKKAEPQKKEEVKEYHELMHHQLKSPQAGVLSPPQKVAPLLKNPHEATIKELSNQIAAKENAIKRENKALDDNRQTIFTYGKPLSEEGKRLKEAGDKLIASQNRILKEQTEKLESLNKAIELQNEITNLKKPTPPASTSPSSVQTGPSSGPLPPPPPPGAGPPPPPPPSGKAQPIKQQPAGSSSPVEVPKKSPSGVSIPKAGQRPLDDMIKELAARTATKREALEQANKEEQAQQLKSNQENVIKAQQEAQRKQKENEEKIAKLLAGAEVKSDNKIINLASQWNTEQATLDKMSIKPIPDILDKLEKERKQIQEKKLVEVTNVKELTSTSPIEAPKTEVTKPEIPKTQAPLTASSPEPTSAPALKQETSKPQAIKVGSPTSPNMPQTSPLPSPPAEVPEPAPQSPSMPTEVPKQETTKTQAQTPPPRPGAPTPPTPFLAQLKTFDLSDQDNTNKYKDFISNKYNAIRSQAERTQYHWIRKWIREHGIDFGYSWRKSTRTHQIESISQSIEYIMKHEGSQQEKAEKIYSVLDKVENDISKEYNSRESALSQVIREFKSDIKKEYPNIKTLDEKTVNSLIADARSEERERIKLKK